AVSPIGALAIGESNWSGPAGVALNGPTVHGSGSQERLRALLRTPGGPSSSHVAVARGPDGAWQYLVNGQPQVLRGVGYNPQYASLEPGERARVYQRDFAAMRQMGMNTIEGWFEGQFDQFTLDV